MANVLFVDVSSGLGSSTTSSTASLPAGWGAGDLAIAFISHTGSSATVTTDATGWTVLEADPNPADFSTLMYYRVLQAGDSTPTWTWSVSGGTACDIVVYRNAVAVSPINDSSAAITSGSSAATGSVTTTAANCLVVGYGVVDVTSGTRTWTYSGSMTERLDNFTNPWARALAEEQIATASAVSRTFTLTGNAQDMALFMVAIEPAVSPAGQTTGSFSFGGTAAGDNGTFVKSRWVGAPTTSGATVAVVTETTTGGASIRLKVSTASDLSVSPTYSSTVVPDANNTAKLSITGLSAGTTYYYGVEKGGVVDTTKTGRFKTAPSSATSFSFVFGSCQRSNIEGDAWTRAKARNPDLCLVTGDFAYMDLTTNDQALFRAEYDARLAFPTVASMLADVATVYNWSDHDFGTDAADGTAATKPAAQAVYRQYVPHHTLVDSAGIYHTFTYGRVRFIVTDERSFKSPRTDTDNSSKTVLGATQKQWFKDTLDAATEPLIFWVGDSPWNGTGASTDDGWHGSTTERTELGSYIAASGKFVVRIGGDTHALGADDGTNTVGGIPVLQAAPWSNDTSVLSGTFSAGKYPTLGNEGTQEYFYGHCQVTDTGTALAVTFNGYDSDDVAQVTMTLTLDAAGSGAGTATFAGAATGTTQRRGQSTGTTSWTGSALSDSTRQGTATGADTWTATTTGTRTPKGQVAGTDTWAGTATGHSVHSGTSAGSDTWTGSTSGKRVPRGTSAGATSWAATTAGKRQPKGAASGASTWGAYAPGSQPHYGTAAGASAWAGSSAGDADLEGSGAGTATWSATTSGTRVPEGTVTAGHTWSGTAESGNATSGTAAGGTAWSGTAAGTRQPKGTAGGSATFAGSSSGITARRGSAASSHTWTASAPGERPNAGTASGSTTWTGSGSSGAQRAGTAAGTTTWTGSTQGRRVPKATAAGTTTWTGSTQGRRAPRGTSAGTTTWSHSTSGTRPARGVCVSAHTWAGRATSPGAVDIDVTIAFGTTRVGTLTVADTRQGWTVAETRGDRGA